MATKRSEKGLLTPDNCVVAIIDLQPQMMFGVGNFDGCKSPHKHLRVKQLSEGWRLDELVYPLPPSTPLSVRHPLDRFGS